VNTRPLRCSWAVCDLGYALSPERGLPAGRTHHFAVPYYHHPRTLAERQHYRLFRFHRGANPTPPPPHLHRIGRLNHALVYVSANTERGLVNLCRSVTSTTFTTAPLGSFPAAFFRTYHTYRGLDLPATLNVLDFSGPPFGYGTLNVTFPYRWLGTRTVTPTHLPPFPGDADRAYTPDGWTDYPPPTHHFPYAPPPAYHTGRLARLLNVRLRHNAPAFRRGATAGPGGLRMRRRRADAERRGDLLTFLPGLGGVLRMTVLPGYPGDVVLRTGTPVTAAVRDVTIRRRHRRWRFTLPFPNVVAVSWLHYWLVDVITAHRTRWRTVSAAVRLPVLR